MYALAVERSGYLSRILCCKGVIILLLFFDSCWPHTYRYTRTCIYTCTNPHMYTHTRTLGHMNTHTHARFFMHNHRYYTHTHTQYQSEPHHEVINFHDIVDEDERGLEDKFSHDFVGWMVELLPFRMVMLVAILFNSVIIGIQTNKYLVCGMECLG